jgi:hypothetical protein
VEKTHAPGHALTILAHPLARAVYSRLKRQTAFASDVGLRTAGRGAGAPDASLDAQREAPAGRVRTSSLTAALHATVRRGPLSLRLPRCWAPCSGACKDSDRSYKGTGAAPPPRLTRTGAPDTLNPPFASAGMRARQYCEGAAAPPSGALHWPRPGRSNLTKCVVQSRGLAPGHGHQARTRHRRPTTPGGTRRKKFETSALRRSGSLDKKRPHKGSARGLELARR